MTTRFYFFAGEASGDLHGSRLIQALHADTQNSRFFGVGGPHMRRENFDCLIEMENFQVMGLSDVLKSLPRLWKLFYQVRDQISQIQPDCVVLIDYPGFNLRLARSLRKKGYRGKIVQYICPTIWAHGKKRIETLANNHDLLLTIYPFEAAYFSHTQLKVDYIGNPLVETIQRHVYQSDWKKIIGLPENREIIALFPGSRQGEIQLHAPLQLKAAALLKAKHPQFVFALSCAQDALQKDLVKLAEQGPLLLNDDLFIVPSHYHYELMKSSKAALAKSGTVTLELALHATPSVVHYELTMMNYLFAKYLLRLKLPHYCIVNILANETLFPEFIGRRISSADLQTQLEKMIFDSPLRKNVIAGCKAIQKQLKTDSPHQCAAQEIARILIC